MPQTADYAKLFEPFKLGAHTLKNRVVLGPMSAHGGHMDGRPSDQTIAFFEARARGGVGMIIIGGMVGTGRGFAESPFHPLIRADIDSTIPDLRRVADAVHAYGVPIIGEIAPAFGRMAVSTADRPLIAASPVNVVIPRGSSMPFERVTTPPREATVGQIQDCEHETVQSALRLQRAGLDGVELAAHMSYFLASFLTPRTNLRKDQYGGSVENRARMLCNIVRSIRAKAGPDFIIGLRISSDEYVPGGQGPEGYAQIAKAVEAEGLDYVALTPGCYESINESTVSPRVLMENGDPQAFRAVLSIPILAGGLHDPTESAAAIAAGQIDLIMLARPLLADPEYVNKLTTGRADEIVHCDLDNYCGRRLMMGMPVRCKLNPAMGREHAVANGAPLQDRSLRWRIEEAVLALAGTKPAIQLVAAMTAGKNNANRKAAEAAKAS